MRWVTAPDLADKYAFGFCAKSGTSSLNVALAPYGGFLRCVPTDQFERRVFVVRQPIERWASCWKNKCRDGGKLAGHEVNGMTTDEFLNYTMMEDNIHWLPQSTQLKESGVIPTEIIRLESMNGWWRGEFGTYFPCVNASAPGLYVALPSDTLAILKLYYRDDLRLWENADE